MNCPTLNRGWFIGRPRILHFPQRCCQHDNSTPARTNWVWTVSHPPPNPQSPASFDQVTRLPPEMLASRYTILRRNDQTLLYHMLSIYLFACQKSQRSMSCNMVKSSLTWSRVFHCRHLGRRVTAVTRLRCPHCYIFTSIAIYCYTYVSMLLHTSAPHVW